MYPEQFLVVVLLALFLVIRYFFPRKTLDIAGAIIGAALLLGYAAYGVCHIYAG